MKLPFAAAIVLLLLLVTPPLFLPQPANVIGQSSTSFGVTYLSTHYHYEQNYLNSTLERDLKFFSDSGIKHITLTLIWAYLEPAYQTYNFKGLEEIKNVSSVAAKYGISVIIDFHTLMQDGSWTMPSWLFPRKFEAVFENLTIRQAWMDYLGNCTNYLKDVFNIESWQMMNEPFRQSWACDVSVEEYVRLWTEMRAAIRASSDKPVAIRFSEYGFRSPLHFNWDPRIYDVCDYVALNYYGAEQNSTPGNLTASIADIRSHGKNVMISEFGYETNNDTLKLEKYGEYVDLFEELEVEKATAWFWRADYTSANPNPPGTLLNLAANVAGDPRPAFYELTSVIQPPSPPPTTTSTSTLNPPATPPTPNPTVTPTPLVTSTPNHTLQPSPTSTPVSSPSPPPSVAPTQTASITPPPFPEPSQSSPQPGAQTELSQTIIVFAVAIAVLAIVILYFLFFRQRSYFRSKN